MKKSIYLIVVMAFIVACNSEPHYTISGKIEGADSVTFLIQKRVSGKTVTIDSAFAKKGSFKMTGSVDYPDLVQLVAKEKRYRVNLFLENAPIEITGTIDSLYDATITGSKSHDEYAGFQKAYKVLSDKYAAIYQEYQVAKQANDTEKAAGIEKQASEIEKEILQSQKDFIMNNPSSYVSPTILRSISYELEAGEIEAAIIGMDTAVASLPVVKDLMARAMAMKTVSVGMKAPDFTLNDVNGVPVSLYSKLGPKLLLVDFWAGWCGPCRQENPNVVKVYNQFNKKGFDVFGVSLDRTKDEWTNAIADDKLTWTHVSDLQYWSSAAARLYAVNAIPANFLLDESGTIIGRNLRGEDLYNKVNEMLGVKN